jgi:hypothetical protein
MIIVVPSCLKDADGARTRSDQKEEKKSMIIVVPSCLKDADGARTRSDQYKQETCRDIRTVIIS